MSHITTSYSRVGKVLHQKAMTLTHGTLSDSLHRSYRHRGHKLVLYIKVCLWI